MSDVRTWSAEEVQALMLRTIKTYQKDFLVTPNKSLSYREMVERIYATLDENGLIEHTPEETDDAR